jgi:cob(I)alamin adenosyltransferase
VGFGGEGMSVHGEKKGNVIVFTGRGKGKTTAALGLACRAVGHGRRAAFIHFTGPMRARLGDVCSTKELGAKVTMIAIESQASDKAYLDQFDETVATVEAALDRAEGLLAGGECDLLVLDDINPLLDQGLVEQSVVKGLIETKPPSVTIVFTGRSAPDAVMELADIVTDFAEVKHPVRAGVAPRKGIEF